jgi:hypothetical protein
MIKYLNDKLNTICDKYNDEFTDHEKSDHLKNTDVFIIFGVGGLFAIITMSVLFLFHNTFLNIIQILLDVYMLIAISVVFLSNKLPYKIQYDYNYLFTLPAFILFVISYKICYNFLPYRGDDVKILRKYKLKKISRTR